MEWRSDHIIYSGLSAGDLRNLETMMCQNRRHIVTLERVLKMYGDADNRGKLVNALISAHKKDDAISAYLTDIEDHIR